MSTKLFDSTTFVEKHFGMTLRGFETRVFIVPRRNCSVCDESVHNFNVRQVEPTFTDDPVPEYEFLHNYDFLSAKLLFNNPENSLEKVSILLEFHVCRNNLWVTISYNGPNPFAHASIQISASLDSETQLHQISEDCLKLTKNEKFSISSSGASNLNLGRFCFIRQDLKMKLKIRLYYPWKIQNQPSLIRSFDFGPDPDVCLMSNTEEKFFCPKSFLVDCSDVFARMFSTKMKETSSNLVRFPDLETKILKQFVFILHSRFSNTQSLKDSETEDLSELLVLAELYDISRLKLECEAELLNRISLENACTILSIGLYYNAPMLAAGSMDWIQRSWSRIFGSDQWKDLESVPEVASYLLRTMAGRNL